MNRSRTPGLLALLLQFAITSIAVPFLDWIGRNRLGDRLLVWWSPRESGLWPQCSLSMFRRLIARSDTDEAQHWAAVLFERVDGQLASSEQPTTTGMTVVFLLQMVSQFGSPMDSAGWPPAALRVLTTLKTTLKLTDLELPEDPAAVTNSDLMRTVEAAQAKYEGKAGGLA